MKLSFKEIASRITGVSLPIFGVSWNPPESERKIVRGLLLVLEDRRALFNDYAFEIEHEVSQSVLQIRSEITTTLQRLPEDSEAVGSLRAMRAACREYLDNTRRGFGPRFQFMLELGKLRALFGQQIAYLAVKYGLDIEGDLASILPPDTSEDRAKGRRKT
ncbi:MAG TPA: DUF6650 family protein [Candidatus Binatia bacterium]|nr:DUF6650 family protein [Candidatus Binatia bacterium]